MATRPSESNARDYLETRLIPSHLLTHSLTQTTKLFFRVFNQVFHFQDAPVKKILQRKQDDW